MADEQPSLHIDTDWKKQAQEEKRKLVEEQKAKAAAAAPPPPPGAGPAPASAASAPTAAASPRTGREMPPPSFASLVQSVVTQVLFYLGDLTPRGSEPQLNLDMAKYQIDILGVLEEKTKGNLSPEEQHMLDAALYETRMRYVNVASQIVNGQ